jgi:hypothetical protein
MRSRGATRTAPAQLAVRFSVSLARAVKPYVPGARGAPTIVPRRVRLTPAGSAPPTTDHVNLPVPPLARKDVRNGALTSERIGATGAATIETGFRTLTVNCFCVRFPAQVAGSFSGSRIST